LDLTVSVLSYVASILLIDEIENFSTVNLKVTHTDSKIRVLIFMF